MGNVKITQAVPAIVVIAVVVIAVVMVSGMNLSLLMGVLDPTPTVTTTSTPSLTPTLTPIATATIGLTKTPVFSSPIPCSNCGEVHFAIATPMPLQEIRQTTFLKLRQFVLDTSVSSYIFDGKYYELDENKMTSMILHGCLPATQNFLPRIKTNLQLFAKRSGRENLLPYIQTDEQVQMLRVNRPEVVNELMPTSAEWRNMDSIEYEALNKWQLNCVGIPWPAWYVTLENISDQEQVITKIVYRTFGVFSMRGGEGGAVSPQVTYINQIDWKVGDQIIELEPSYRIPPRSNSSLELMLTTAVPRTGLGWDMQIFFVIDEDRGGVSTERFSLMMSGLPNP